MFHSEKGLSHKSDDLRSIPSTHAEAGHGDACPWLQLWGGRKKKPWGLLATRLGESVPRSARCGSSENKVEKWLKWHLASVCTHTHMHESTCAHTYMCVHTHTQRIWMNENLYWLVYKKNTQWRRWKIASNPKERAQHNALLISLYLWKIYFNRCSKIWIMPIPKDIVSSL